MSQKSKLPLYAGAAAVGAVGYYLYSAGGSPKVAEKKFERKSIKSRVDWQIGEIVSLIYLLQMMSHLRLPD